MSILGPPNDPSRLRWKNTEFWDGYNDFYRQYIAITVFYSADGRVEQVHCSTFRRSARDVLSDLMKR